MSDDTTIDKQPTQLSAAADITDPTSAQDTTENAPVITARAMLEGAHAPVGTEVDIKGVRMDDLPIWPVAIDARGRLWRLDRDNESADKLVCVGEVVK